MEPTRRFVDSDNSCLFSSIGYLIDNKNFNETTKLQYRQLLTNFIEDNNVDISRDELRSLARFLSAQLSPSRIPTR